MDVTSFILGSIAGAKSASGLRYLVVQELPEVGQNNVIYLVPKTTSKTNNYYDEYMWINNDWERIGDTEIDLSNYVQNTDYATLQKGGVVKPNNGFNLSSSGETYARNDDYTTYQTRSNQVFISKGTLENVIDGKGLITQYSTLPTASADNLGKIVQYTGTTDSTYTNGYFYQCVSDGEDPATYSWENIEVQDGGSSEPQYIIDKGGNKLYFVRFLNNDTYKQDVFFPTLQQLIDDYENGIKSYIYIGEEYSSTNMPTYDYRSSIFFIQSVSTYTGLKQYYIKSTQVGPLKMSGSFIIQKTFYSGFINYNTNTNKVDGYSINNTAENLISVLPIDNSSSYTPTGNYNPATKKYVDDTIASAIGTALQGNY